MLKGYLYRKLFRNDNKYSEMFFDVLMAKRLIEGKTKKVAIKLDETDVRVLLTILDMFIDYAKQHYELDDGWFILRNKLEKALKKINKESI